jgi:hypothetical protein
MSPPPFMFPKWEAQRYEIEDTEGNRQDSKRSLD